MTKAEHGKALLEYERTYGKALLEYERTKAKEGKRPKLPCDMIENRTNHESRFLSNEFNDDQIKILQILEENGAQSSVQLGKRINKKSVSVSLLTKKLPDIVFLFSSNQSMYSVDHCRQSCCIGTHTGCLSLLKPLMDIVDALTDTSL